MEKTSHNFGILSCKRQMHHNCNAPGSSWIKRSRLDEPNRIRTTKSSCPKWTSIGPSVSMDTVLVKECSAVLGPRDIPLSSPSCADEEDLPFRTYTPTFCITNTNQYQSTFFQNSNAVVSNKLVSKTYKLSTLSLFSSVSKSKVLLYIVLL